MPDTAAGYQPRAPDQSVLYRTVTGSLETFLAQTRARDRIVPRFVERELRAYLECGIASHGFLRVHCDACGFDRIVPFSCKGRAFCPSCGGRRMADTAAHLGDRVFPEVPVRQWVLSLPVALRYRLAFDSALTAEVLRAFVRALSASLRRRARARRPFPYLQPGAVTFVQRFGDALNLNVHFHVLALDGVFGGSDPGTLRFVPLEPPGDDEILRVLEAFSRRLDRLMARRGLPSDADPDAADPLQLDAPLLAEIAAASVGGRTASGPRAGRRPNRLGDRIDSGSRDDPPPGCASAKGISLHATVAVPARDRKRLERLCRYAARPAVAAERLSEHADGRLVYRLRHRWRDGTTHMLFEPIELLERLAALVPPPRFHMVRYHGILAPAAGRRDAVVPARIAPSCRIDASDVRDASRFHMVRLHGILASAAGRRDAVVPARIASSCHIDTSDVRGACEIASGDDEVLEDDTDRIPNSPLVGPTAHATPDRSVHPRGDIEAYRNAAPDQAQPDNRLDASAVGKAPDPPHPASTSPSYPRRLPWAQLLARVFALDALTCPRCQHPTRVIAAIQSPEAIRAILECLGLPSRPPPIAPASQLDLPADDL